MAHALVKEALFDNALRAINITWSDGCSSRYHYVWLLHNARCPEGMTNDTSVKIDLLPDDPTTLKVDNLWCDEDGFLKIIWAERPLETRHGLSTLKRWDYSEDSRQHRKHIPILWTRENQKDIPGFEYASLNSEHSQLELLAGIRDFGLVKLQNVPTVPGTIANVATMIGPLHVNNYGRIFDVRTDTNQALGSNTGAYLGPHTDEGYRHAPPGISLFHCLRASDAGGESILVDGFHAANVLRETDPASFEVLTRIPVFYQRHAPPEENMLAHGRVIVLDVDGQVQGIRFTDRTIPPQDVPGNMVESLYTAIAKFWKIVNDENNAHTYLMRPGDLHIFDNHRVLHGRTSFDPAGSERHLQQCSVNRDEFHNTLRCLAEKLGVGDAMLEMAGGANG